MSANKSLKRQRQNILYNDRKTCSDLFYTCHRKIIYVAILYHIDMCIINLFFLFWLLHKIEKSRCITDIFYIAFDLQCKIYYIWKIYRGIFYICNKVYVYVLDIVIE